MKSSAVAFVLGLLCCTSLAAAGRVVANTRDHPIENVIGMLQGLSDQAVSEGKSEALLFEKFTYWCRSSEKELNTAINEEKQRIDELESEVSSKTEECATLTSQISDLTGEIGDLDAEQTAADRKRTSMNNDYTDVNSDFQLTIDAIKNASAMMKEAKTNTSTLLAVRKAEMLLQLYGPRDDTEARRNNATQAQGNLNSHVKKYSFKSGSVVEMLKQLQAQFEEEQLQATKEETNSINNFELAKQARTEQKTAASKSKTTKTGELSDANSTLNTAKTELADEEGDLDADSNTLDTTTKSCAVKKSEWAERSETREGEIKAIAMAVKILAKVGGVRTEAPGNPVPPANPMDAESATTFLQVSDPKMKAVNLLRHEARVVHSKAMERLAQEVQAHLTGPFDQVNNMIEKMIYRLKDEQRDEDIHKKWCDEEIEKNNVTKNRKEDKIEDLKTKIDAADATAQELNSQIKDANTMIDNIVSHVTEATEIRNIGKKENAVSIKDAQDAQNAVAQAIAVLEDFYKQSGAIAKEPYEFLQSGKRGVDDQVDLPADPATWDSSYTGVSGDTQPAGIVGVLKTTASDFASMEANTKAQEVTDQKAYDDDMKACKIEKARRTKEGEMKSQEEKRLVDKSKSMAKERKQQTSELEAVNQYLKDLKPACTDGDSSYADRKAARAQEIEALGNATDILADAFLDRPDANATDNTTTLLQKRLRA